jgi:carbonic anhydrase
MSLLSEIMQHNAEFVSRKGYEPFRTTNLPDKKMVIVSCMDTRLIELLPHAMNIKNGDVKVIKNAGAIVSHPYGSVMRSILVAVYNLGAQEVAVIGHHGCGMAGMNCGKVIEAAKARGISEDVFNAVRSSGVDLDGWLTGFADVGDGVRESVKRVKNHPLLPDDVPVHGLVIDPDTGKLDWIVNGYEHVEV